MRTKNFFAGLLMTLASALSASCLAAPITYTISGTASGTLGGTAFQEKAFQAVALGDTDARIPIDVGVYVLALQSVDVTVDGVGSGLAVNAFSFFVNQPLSEVGLIENLSGDVLDVSSSALAAYDGISSLAGTPVANDFMSSFSTTGGLFALDTASNLLFSARRVTAKQIYRRLYGKFSNPRNLC